MIQKLMTYDGGQPLYASDLAFMQDAFLKTVNEFSKGFGDTYILYGTVDESRENCIAGAVVIAGEIYSVPSELGAIGQNKLCFRYADTDERTFYDASQKKVKRTCEAYLSTDTSGAVAYIDLTTAVRIDDGMKKLAGTVDENAKLLPRAYSAESNDGISNSRNGSRTSFTMPGMNAAGDDHVFFSINYIIPQDSEITYSMSGILYGTSDSFTLNVDGGYLSVVVNGDTLSLGSDHFFLQYASKARCVILKGGSQ